MTRKLGNQSNITMKSNGSASGHIQQPIYKKLNSSKQLIVPNNHLINRQGKHGSIFNSILTNKDRTLHHLSNTIIQTEPASARYFGEKKRSMGSPLMTFNLKGPNDLIRQKQFSGNSHRKLPNSAIKPVPRNSKNVKRGRNDLELRLKDELQFCPSGTGANKKEGGKGESPLSSMSSSSCGSIEREADNQENMDELTLEEQAMTYGIAN